LLRIFTYILLAHLSASGVVTRYMMFNAILVVSNCICLALLFQMESTPRRIRGIASFNGHCLLLELSNQKYF